MPFVNYDGPTGIGKIRVEPVGTPNESLVTSNIPLRILTGSVALSGSNPTSVVTGLTNILAGWATLTGSTAPGDGTSEISCEYKTQAGTLKLYAWSNTGGTDPTLVASSGTETVTWTVIGF